MSYDRLVACPGDMSEAERVREPNVVRGGATGSRQQTRTDRQMTACPFCGFESDKGALACHRCGHLLDPSGSASSSSSSAASDGGGPKTPVGAQAPIGALGAGAFAAGALHNGGQPGDGGASAEPPTVVNAPAVSTEPATTVNTPVGPWGSAGQWGSNGHNGGEPPTAINTPVASGEPPTTINTPVASGEPPTTVHAPLGGVFPFGVAPALGSAPASNEPPTVGAARVYNEPPTVGAARISNEPPTISAARISDEPATEMGVLPGFDNQPTSAVRAAVEPAPRPVRRVERRRPGDWAWGVLAIVAAALCALGGALPAVNGSSQTLDAATPGLVLTVGLAAALVIFGIDVIFGTRHAIGGVGGVGTAVLSTALVYGVLLHATKAKPDNGAVCLLAAGILGAFLAVGALAWGLGGTVKVRGLVAVLVAAGSVTTVVGLSIPPSGVSAHRYMYGTSLDKVALIAPIVLTGVCALVVLASRNCGAMLMAVGNAVGMLGLWGATAITGQHDAIPYLRGQWVIVACGLGVTILAGLLALVMAYEANYDAVVATPEYHKASGTFFVGLAPMLAVLLALVAVPYQLIHRGTPIAVFGSPPAKGVKVAGPPHPKGPGAPPKKTPEQVQAGRIEAILQPLIQQSGAARQAVQQAVQEVQGCRTDPNAAATTAQQSAQVRSGFLNRIQGLDVSAIPNGSTMISHLENGLTDSIQADNSYGHWMQFVASSGCNRTAKYNSDYKNAETQDSQADTAKSSFVSMWNPLAAQYGYPPVDPAQV